VVASTETLTHYEKDIPTLGTQATQQARLSQAHGICQWTQRIECTTGERPDKIVGEYGTTPQRHRALIALA
tara:strand:- start:361 stop:573 length:213 start_codon:yes stop_codon:yes gene_type:complete